MATFFVAFIIIGAFFILNLFVSAIIDKVDHNRETLNDLAGQFHEIKQKKVEHFCCPEIRRNG